jgi:uncharacterized membrane protein
LIEVDVNPRGTHDVKSFMPEKRSKYDTDPLDPEFVRRTEEMMGGGTSDVEQSDETVPLRRDAATEEKTRRFDEQAPDSYPSVFVPPVYQPPRPQPQPFTSFGAGQPPAQVTPQPGPSSPYPFNARPSSRPVTRLGLPENVANLAPYLPFYIGLVVGLVELFIVPRNETRTRFHAAQGLALHLAIIAGSLLFKIVGLITGSGFGGVLFSVAAFAFLVISAIRVWQGKPHHIAPLDEGTLWLDKHISPMK